MTEKIMAMLLIMVSMLVLTGCNTFHGIDKDIKKGGETLEKAAAK